MPANDVHDWLGWPHPDDIFDPPGAGAQVYADFAQRKIGGGLKQKFPGLIVKVGVIPADPTSDSTENPLAVVCEFPRPARREELDFAHTLAWNFSRTALLITLEPHQLTAWSCYLDPDQPAAKRRICTMPVPGKFKPDGSPEQREVRDLLHWVNLITSRAQRDLPEKFPGEGRADAMLLRNMRYVRRELMRMDDLPKEHCHDLLARVIFTQFLFHRKDREGQAFFSDRVLKRLQEDRTLSKHYPSLADILTDKADTYALFAWMDGRFNGDLFPGKDGQSEAEREAAWETERQAVTKDHLCLLAGLIRGDLDVPGQQLTLWRHYSFDTIPLEFISSVYEEFLTADERQNDKAYYTPSHLVDYVLDAVLPWNDENWNIRILDPCCGSAIFLVKAFQRLIHRWRLANKRDPLVSDLRPILANNLVGVDKNPEAVRVACFSLYLAMADAIEPKHYTTRDNVKVFPRLRGTSLLPQDFFDEETAGLRSSGDANTYDLVLGNAPWGEKSVAPKLENETEKAYAHRIKQDRPKAVTWATAQKWPVPNFDIGPVFLGKAATLVKPDGRVAMVNTASLLYWRDGKAVELRERLFDTFTFDEITNLSALRRELFTEAIGPACVVVFGKEKPRPESTLHYFTPKPVRSQKTARGKQSAPQAFTIEPQDVNLLTHKEAKQDSSLWPLLALGNRRDLGLIRRLSQLPNLATLKKDSQVLTRLGVIPGNRKRELPKEFKKRRYLGTARFPKEGCCVLDASLLPTWDDPRVADSDSTDFEAFKNPQLLIKQSLVSKEGRFHAQIVKSDDPDLGVICKKTYLSVRDLNADAAHIRAACVVYNSRLATYFLALTSSRIGHYITETLSEELVTVPLPVIAPDVAALDSFEAIDEATRKMFGLTAADWNLIEDFLDYTLPDALRQTPGPARQATKRKDNKGTKEPELTTYVKTFSRVLKSTFGQARSVTATVYTEPDKARQPVRMVTIHLDAKNRQPLSVEPIAADGLLDELAKLHTQHLARKGRAISADGLGFQRVAYFFQPAKEDGARVMRLTIVKPDECRYWTRSAAMRDADQLAVAIAKAASGKLPPA